MKSLFEHFTPSLNDYLGSIWKYVGNGSTYEVTNTIDDKCLIITKLGIVVFETRLETIASLRFSYDLIECGPSMILL